MKKRIGILTFHSSYNYGAFLQAYSLASFLEKNTGAKVEIINYESSKGKAYYKQKLKNSLINPISYLYYYKKYRVFDKAICDNRFISKESLCSDNLVEFKQFITLLGYDLIVVGSDEIWKVDGNRGFPNAFWLPNIEDTHKISFAASSRNEIEKLDSITINTIRNCLQDFDYIGVRDEKTKKLIEQIVDDPSRCHLNCDPTFLWDFKIDKTVAKRNIEKKYHLDQKKKTICLMIEKKEVIKCLPKDIFKRFNCISVFEHIKYTKGLIPPDPFEWMEIIAGSDALITTFFHGMVFSIKNYTPFLIIEPRKISEPNASKSYDLLARNNTDSFFCSYYLMGMDLTKKRINGFLKTISQNNFEFNYDRFIQNERNRIEDYIKCVKTALQ